VRVRACVSCIAQMVRVSRGLNKHNSACGMVSFYKVHSCLLHLTTRCKANQCRRFPSLINTMPQHGIHLLNIS